MEQAGLGLAVLVEVRTIVKSLPDRISCFQEETLVAEARNALAHVNDLFGNITSVLEARTKAFPKEFLTAFKSTSDNVKSSLAVADKNLDKYLSQVSFDNASTESTVVRAGVKTKQLVRAKSITQGLLDVLSTANRAEVKQQHQLSQLCTAVQFDDLKEDRRILIERNRFAVQHFRPAFNAPALFRNVRLDFNSMDENGEFATPEGRLRHCVFRSTPTLDVSLTSNAPSPMLGVSGMAGAGKTTALIELGHDISIRTTLLMASCIWHLKILPLKKA